MVLFALIIFAFASCGTSRSVFTANDFNTRAAQHRTVAILPVNVVRSGHVGRRETDASIRRATEEWAVRFQEMLHSYVVGQAGRKRKGPVVGFQGTAQTNNLLKEAGLTIEQAYLRNPQDLAKMLGVDAVMMTTLDQRKNVSDGLGIAIGAGRDILQQIGIMGTGTSIDNFNATDIRMNAAVYDGSDGRLLWKTFREGGEDMPHNVNELVQWYCNWIARKQPYRG